MHKNFGVGTLKKSDFYIYSEVLAELGIATAHEQILKSGKIEKRDPIHYALVRANLRNPRYSQSIPGPWLDGVNELFVRENLNRIEIDFESEFSLLDAITTSSTKICGSPLVSVIGLC